MLNLIIGAILLSISTDVVQGKYLYRPQIRGWIAQHKIIATWDEAYQKCRSEDYAVLASPITAELLAEMTSLIPYGISYFIGTRSMYTRGPFMSIEGVALEDMAATDMFDHLDAQAGDCLSMSRDKIRVVQCNSRLPFMCLKQQDADMETTECGTYDKEYKLDLSTGTCYKLHQNKKNWYQAYSMCVADGGHLAVFNDEHEAQFIKNMTHPDGNEVFVGLQDREGNGDWMSVHGTRIEKLYNVWIWGPVKPIRPNYKCAVINVNSAELYTRRCDIKENFLCARNATNSWFPQASNDNN